MRTARQTGAVREWISITKKLKILNTAKIFYSSIYKLLKHKTWTFKIQNYCKVYGSRHFVGRCTSQRSAFGHRITIRWSHSSYAYCNTWVNNCSWFPVCELFTLLELLFLLVWSHITLFWWPKYWFETTDCRNAGLKVGGTLYISGHYLEKFKLGGYLNTVLAILA